MSYLFQWYLRIHPELKMKEIKELYKLKLHKIKTNHRNIGRPNGLVLYFRPIGRKVLYL